MKGRLAAALCLAFSTWATSAAPTQLQKSTEYVYADAGFAISAPTQPSQDKWTQKSPAGPVEVHFYGIGLNAGSEFSITATNLNLADRRTPQRILTDGKNGAAAAVKGKVVSETSITLGKYPGMQLEMETPRFHSRARQYVVGRTSYELLVSCTTRPTAAGGDGSLILVLPFGEHLAVTLTRWRLEIVERCADARLLHHT